MTAQLFRRCGCRRDDARQYPALPERPTDAQRAAACPRMTDPKHGRWSYRLSGGTDPRTGKRVQINGRTYPTKKEAAQARNADEAKIDRGTFVKPTRETFAEYLTAWLPRHAATGRGLRASTLENYTRYVVQDIAPSALGRMRLTDIRRHHVNAFIADLSAAGRGAVTVRRIVAVVQGSLRSATIEQKIADNPATMLQLPRVDAEPFTPWQPEQVGAFLDATADHRLGALFEVAVFTGLRRAELLALRWDDVDLPRGVLSVRQSKTAAGLRIVDLDDRTVGAFVAWRARQLLEAQDWGPAWTNTGLVFTREDGVPLRPEYVTRLFDRLRVSCELPRMTFHGLRHMHASLMLASGTSLAVVSKRLGHSSVQVTGDVYAHLIGSASRDAANRAAALVPTRQKAPNSPQKLATVRTLCTHGPEDAAEAASASA